MKKIGIPTGFSLIELIIVIALISIIAAFAVPVWQRYTANTNLKSAAREVMADISNARQQAVEENLDFYRLAFSVASNNYALFRTDTGATSWTKPVASLGNGVLIGSVNFSGGSTVSFQARGTVSMGNLTLRNGLGSTATITVNITGRSYVQYNMQ